MDDNVRNRRGASERDYLILTNPHTSHSRHIHADITETTGLFSLFSQNNVYFIVKLKLRILGYTVCPLFVEYR